MKFSFVIPAYNNYRLLHALLWDIWKNCKNPYEVIVTDDGNDNETLDGLKWWDSVGLLPIKHLRHNQVGFLLNSNYGLQKATGELVALVSTDVRIHRDITTYWVNADTLIGGRYLDFDTGWNTFDGKIFPYIEGWLLCMYKTNWEKVGYFDEHFAPNDMEDVDISTTAIEKGLSLKAYPEGYVSHLGAQTIQYGDEREKITLENKKKFYAKWVA